MIEGFTYCFKSSRSWYGNRRCGSVISRVFHPLNESNNYYYYIMTKGLDLIQSFQTRIVTVKVSFQ